MGNHGQPCSGNRAFMPENIMAMKVVPPTAPVAALVMRAAHSLARRWIAEFSLVGEYRDILKAALKFVWDCVRGRAGVARLPRFAATTPRVWRNLVVSVILGVKAPVVTTTHSRPWLKDGEFFQLGWVPIRKIPSLLAAETVGYAYSAATGSAGVFWS